MDGPAHLHNAYLFKQLIFNSEFLSNYYQINTIPIPNWTNHIILSFLLSFVSPSLAEKGTHIIYIVLLAFSFRYFIKQVQPTNSALSFLILPFLFSFLQQLGFINYNFSIAFMFLGIGFYLKHQSHLNFKNLTILSVIILFAYFSNVLGFVYLVCFIFLSNFVIQFGTISIFNKQLTIECVKKHIKLLLICLIPFICLIVFYNTVVFFPSTANISKAELFDWIFDMKPLIIFIYDEDKVYTKFFFLCLIISLGITIYKYYETNKIIKLTINLVFVISLLLTLYLLFNVPDGSSAGMMSDRLCLMLFFIFIATLVSFPVSKNIQFILVGVAIFINLALFKNNRKTIIQDFGLRAEMIYNTSKNIKEKSVVLPINMSENWLEGHFSNYIATDKEIVLLENYEASLGWFPLKWHPTKLPKILLGTKERVNNLSWISNYESKIEKKIDYIFLYGNTLKIDEPSYAELKTELATSYLLDTTTIKNEYIKLFKLKQ
jgi:hypothetical protein